MAIIGGDLELMGNLATTLGHRGTALHDLMGQIAGPVGESASYWKGGKNNELIQAWEAAKPSMQHLVDELQQYSHFTNTTAGNIGTAAN